MAEKRRYFRINDDFEVRYVPADGATAVADGRARDLRELRALLARLRLQSPEVAEAFALIERRLLSLERDGGVAASTEASPGLNLSGCGVAFLTNDTLAVGQRLHLELYLHGDEPVLAAEGSVVACQPASGRLRRRANIVRVDLLNMRDSEAEALVQYVLRRQAQMLRANRHVDSPWIT
jgi:hypothetical protein